MTDDPSLEGETDRVPDDRADIRPLWGRADAASLAARVQQDVLRELRFAGWIRAEERWGAAPGRPRWMHVVWIHAAALVLLFAVMHMTGGGLRLH